DVVHAASVSGDVRIPDARRSANLSSVSGDVHLGGSNLQDVRMNSASGGIRFDAGFLPGASIVVETASGRVDFRTAVDAAAEYHARTITGSIRNEIGPDAERSGRFVPGEELRFSIGTNGANIGLRTVSGEIRISAQ